MIPFKQSDINDLDFITDQLFKCNIKTKQHSTQFDYITLVQVKSAVRVTQSQTGLFTKICLIPQ